MIAWAIEVAAVSKLFDRILVSTDDEAIAELAISLGAEVPFIRPKNLSDDSSTTSPVIVHAIKFLAHKGVHPQNVCCIYPCVPFLLSTDLIDGLNLLESKAADFVYPVCEYPHPIQRALSLTPDNYVKILHPEYELTRTQDLDVFYHDAGQFYWGSVSAWLGGKRMHSEGVALPVPGWRFVDIDTEDDWLRAELIFRAFKAD